jgi:hypothetical protein
MCRCFVEIVFVVLEGNLPAESHLLLLACSAACLALDVVEGLVGGEVLLSAWWVGAWDCGVVLGVVEAGLGGVRGHGGCVRARARMAVSCVVAASVNFHLAAGVLWANLCWDWDGLMHDWGSLDALSSAFVQEGKEVVGGAGHGGAEYDVLVDAWEIALHLGILLLEHSSNWSVDGIASSAGADVAALMANASVVFESLTGDGNLKGGDDAGVGVRHCGCGCLVDCWFVVGWYCEG